MRLIKMLLMACVLVPSTAWAQETFSIVAVDSATGKVGSAGASCLDDDDVEGGVYIISDVVPGKGAIHTQAFYREINQENAHDRMLDGLSPDSILRWVIKNDVVNQPERRQYGIALFDSSGSPQTAAFTGDKADSFKDHYTGPNYAIQGNILKGPEVLDSMRARFQRSNGPLEERLMAALQGANMPGADRRCLQEGVSSQSAFIRVAKPQDKKDQFYLDLLVSKTPQGHEPIDSLQKLYDQWEKTAGFDQQQQKVVTIYPNPANGAFQVQMTKPLKGKHYLNLYAVTGQLIYRKPLSKETNIDLAQEKQGVFYFRVIKKNGGIIQAGKIMLK